MLSYPLIISRFLCVSGHPNHKVSIVGLDIYHGHFLCVLALMFVFAGRIAFHCHNPFPGVTFCLFCEFLFSLGCGSHVVIEGPLPGSSFLGCFLSVPPLPVYLVHFLAVLAMFNFSWPWYHSCFQVFVPLFCLP